MGSKSSSMNTKSEFTWDQESNGWYARHRLSNGQYCMIAFFQCYTSRAIYYYVAFAVADKKKSLNGWFSENKNNNIECRMTGRCGVEALFWCRDRILEFEKFVHRDKTYNTKIVVQGADAKRFRLYEKGLSRYGYKKSFMGGGWSMVKSLGRNAEVSVND